MNGIIPLSEYPPVAASAGGYFVWSDMKDTNKLKDYRKKYKRHYNIDFSGDYVIHHIDFDRTNNDISNLLLMPKELHGKYHFCVGAMKLENDGKGPSFTINAKIQSSLRNSWYLSTLENFSDVMLECSKWYDFKKYLDGLMPNVHGIILE